MKKVFAFSIVLMLFAAVLCTHAGAAQSVAVDIQVNIKNGGTAVIISEVNSPLPDRSSMTLDDGQTEAFHIEFSEAGSYSYTIRTEPDDRKIYFDNTVYQIKVYVTEENGKLYTSIVIYNEKTGKKYSPSGEGGSQPCMVTFVNDPSQDEPDKTEPSTAPENTTSAADTQPTAEATDKTPGGTSRPQTGDDSTLDFYLLLAIAASAGLFMLSVFYYRSVIKETQKR